MKKKIKITDDYNRMWRIGGAEYAKKHTGKEYVAKIEYDGWAYIDDAKFHPDTFKIIGNENMNDKIIAKELVKIANTLVAKIYVKDLMKEIKPFGKDVRIRDTVLHMGSESFSILVVKKEVYGKLKKQLVAGGYFIDKPSSFYDGVAKDGEIAIMVRLMDEKYDK